MKAICFKSVENIETLEIPDPVIVDDRDAIIKVSLAGLCGSDLHPFFGRESGLDVDTIMGHEFVGTIVDLGTAAKSAGLIIGNRVCAPFSTNCGNCFYCQNGLPSRCTAGQLFGWLQNSIGLQGCQSEYVRVPFADATLLKLPPEISDEAALLLGDNFSTGYYCAQMAEIKPDGIYAVIGCGTVGQLCVLSAIEMGAKKVFAIDPVSSRRKQAQSLGAIPLSPDESVKPILDATDGRGADSVMELVGLPDAQKLAFQIIRPGGIMSVIGCHCTPSFAFGPVDAYDKNLTYRTGRCPARSYMDQLMPKVAAAEFDLSGFVTHYFSIDDSKLAYDVFSNRKHGCAKAVIDMK